MQDCIFDGNRAGAIGGAILAGAGHVFRNCLIINNRGSRGGGINANGLIISGCTIASNYATVYGGGIYSANNGSGCENCIIYYNKSADASSSNYYNLAGYNMSFSNCCTAPAFTDPAITDYSTNNIFVDPGVINWEDDDYRLTRDSLCVNAGVYRDWMSGASDLAGYSRIDKFSGLVDMGCFERVPSGMLFGGR